MIVVFEHHTVFNEIEQIFLIKFDIARVKGICDSRTADCGNSQQNIIDFIGFFLAVKIEKCCSDLSAVAHAVDIDLFGSRVLKHAVNVSVKVGGAFFNIHSEIGAEIEDIIVPVLTDITAEHRHDLLLVHILSVLVFEQIGVV